MYANHAALRKSKSKTLKTSSFRDSPFTGWVSLFYEGRRLVPKGIGNGTLRPKGPAIAQPRSWALVEGLGFQRKGIRPDRPKYRTQHDLRQRLVAALQAWFPDLSNPGLCFAWPGLDQLPAPWASRALSWRVWLKRSYTFVSCCFQSYVRFTQKVSQIGRGTTHL